MVGRGCGTVQERALEPRVRRLLAVVIAVAVSATALLAAGATPVWAEVTSPPDAAGMAATDPGATAEAPEADAPDGGINPFELGDRMQPGGFSMVDYGGNGGEPFPDFRQWRAGDVHVHSTGDNGIRDYPAVSHPDCYGSNPAADRFACADRLVEKTIDHALANGLEWAILTEHVPWLGVSNSQDLVKPCPLIPVLCVVTVDNVVFDDQQAREDWFTVRSSAADGALHRTAPNGKKLRLLVGQELGTASAVSVPQTILPYLVPIFNLFGQCPNFNAGHFGVYYAPYSVEDSPTLCDESEYLANTENAESLFGKKGWGGINHPRNPDKGSSWHCWADGSGGCDGTDPITSGSSIYSANPDATVRSMEIISSDFQPEGSTLDRWNDLLSTGTMIAAVGGSDSHSVNRDWYGPMTPSNLEHAGSWGRTLAWLPNDITPGIINAGAGPASDGGPAAPDDDLGPFDASDPGDPVRWAIAGGKTVATNGPKVVSWVNDAGPGEMTLAPSDGPLTVNVAWEGETYKWGDGATPSTIKDYNDHGPSAIRVAVGRIDPGHDSEARRRLRGDHDASKDTATYHYYLPTPEDRTAKRAAIEIPNLGTAGNTDLWVRVETYYPDPKDGSTEADADAGYGLEGFDQIKDRGNHRGLQDQLGARQRANVPSADIYAYTSATYVRTTAIQDVAGCLTGQLPPDAPSTMTAGWMSGNDDDSLGPIQLPFDVNLFGTHYENAWINNNGTVTFADASGKFTSYEIGPETTPMFAAYFADVDTRGDHARVTYSYGTSRVLKTKPFTFPYLLPDPTEPPPPPPELEWEERSVLCVTWGPPIGHEPGVGYFDRHSDLRNSFQLVLTGAVTPVCTILILDCESPPDPGFDAVFNYGQIEWETGDFSGGSGGFGGTSASVGWTAGDGNPEHAFELDGSRVTGSFPDPGSGGLPHGSGLANRTEDGARGRFRYRISATSGSPNAASGSILGVVRYPDGTPVGAGAPVQACQPGGIRCAGGKATEFDGGYYFGHVPDGAYTVTVFPPTDARNTTKTSVTVQVSGGAVTQDVTLKSITPAPPGVQFNIESAQNRWLRVYRGQPVTLFRKYGRTGCTASYLATDEGPSFTLTGNLFEETPGIYKSDPIPIPPTSVGTMTMNVTFTCPPKPDPEPGDPPWPVPSPGDSGNITFPFAYFDPSGNVLDQDGAPIPGAEVTVLRSASPDGPFFPIPDGSPMMSPENRTNPSSTDALGAFAWDVVEGYYFVEARKPGCVSLDHPERPYVRSEIGHVPPEIVGLELRMHCTGADIRPPAIALHFDDPRLRLLETQLIGTASVDEPGTWELWRDTDRCGSGLLLDQGFTDGVAAQGLDIAADDLVDGPNLVRLCATDREGNTSSTDQFVFKEATGVDVAISGLTPTTDTGDDHTDGITSVSDIEITGTSGAGGVVELRRDGSVVATPTTSASGIWSVPDHDVTPGAHVYTAQARYPADNSRSIALVPLLVVIDPAAPDTTATLEPSGGRVTLGSDESGSFECAVDGTPFGPCDADQVLPPTGGRFAARAVDRAGNVDPTPVEVHLFDASSTVDAPDADLVDGACATSTGDCTLRAAIQQSNASSGPDVIRLRPRATYPIDRAGRDEDAAAVGDLDVTGDVSIQGDGTLIVGAGVDRLFHVRSESGSAPHVEMDHLLVVSGNATGPDGGGGILVDAGTLAVRRSFVFSNRSGGGGGGIRFAASSTGGLIEGSVLAGNEGSDAGGLRVEAPVLVRSSTLAGNRAAIESGVGGIAVGAGTAATLSSTIVAGAAAGDDADCSPGISSAGHNLADDASCGLGAEGDQPGVDPVLHNGGIGYLPPVFTDGTSPGVDAGGDDCPAEDLRGVVRPQGGACDVGALELEAPILVDVTYDGLDTLPGDGDCDDGTAHCPLRAAVMEANARGGTDVIELAPAAYVLDRTGSGEDESRTGDLDVGDGTTIRTSSGLALIDARPLGDRAIHVAVTGALDLSQVLVLGGRADGDGGAVLAEGALNVVGAGFLANVATGLGGAIRYATSSPGGVVHQVVLGANAAGDGGALSSGALAVSVEWSTFTANGAGPGGAASLHVSSGVLTAIGNLIAGAPALQCSGNVTSLGHNLSSDGSCSLTGEGDQPETDPLLVSPGFPFPPLVLDPTSPAIDRGGDVCPSVDIAGLPRPAGGGCDIGAYEWWG